MSFAKRHSHFIFYYGLIFLLFLWPLVFLKQTFIGGDYWVQFYPWSFHYASALEGGSLPYWTNLVALGFPLVAEGQVAAYYWLHQWLYRLLPFEAAYTWGIVLHVLAGGIGAYLYAGKIGQSGKAAVFSAILFSFSTTYGGCFYTTGTLRVLTWLPWCLWILEHVREREGWLEKSFWGAWLAFLFSQMETAGFPQLAVYAVGYLALDMALVREKRPNLFAFFGICFAFSVLLALPQIGATAELASASTRQGQTPEFALWGSVMPPALASIIFPSISRFLSVSFYIGIFPLFCLAASLVLPKTAKEKKLLWLALIFALLALGKYNPLYAFVVEKFSLTAFRNPSKFLFFSAMALSFAAGFGFDKIFLKETVWKKALPALTLMGSLIALFPLAASFLFRASQDFWLQKGHAFAEKIALQKGALAKAPEYYQDKMRFLFSVLQEHLNPLAIQNILTAVFASLSVFIVYAALRADATPAKRRRLAHWAFALLIVDLYGFGAAVWGGPAGVGFIGNAGKIPFTETALIQRVQGLQKEWGGVVAELSDHPGGEPLQASSNMLYGIRHAGIYSPLTIKRYEELFGDLGFVDSSTGRRPTSVHVWRNQKPLLDMLGVTVVVADKELVLEGLVFLEQLGRHWIYRNADALPRIYAVAQWKSLDAKEERLAYLKSPAFNPRREAVLEGEADSSIGSSGADIPVVIEKDSQDHARAALDIDRPTVVVFSGVFYPRWKAAVDGVETRLMPVNHALCGIRLETPGRHQVEFFYDYRFHDFLELISNAAWVLLGSLFLWLYWKKRKAPLLIAIWMGIVFSLYLLWVIVPKAWGG
ncbi:MAG: hypothetical protein HY592_01225 [Candidatus Omnitrophica bacterium]|nr:hypothetical protein [Candidatus Omnitrophota bacterium]